RADAPENERDEALAGATDSFVRFVVHIELASNEKEIVADSVKQDRRENKLRLQTGRVHTARQQKIARRPRENADEDGLLIAEVSQHDRQQRSEEHTSE